MVNVLRGGGKDGSRGGGRVGVARIKSVLAGHGKGHHGKLLRVVSKSDTHWFTCLSACLDLHLIYLSVYLSAYLPVRPSVCPSAPPRLLAYLTPVIYKKRSIAQAITLYVPKDR